MMIRYSELAAKRESMEKLSDPRQDIEGPVESAQLNEVEEMREEGQVEISQQDSVGRRPPAERVRRPGRGP